VTDDVTDDHTGNRRIDKIRDPAFVQGLAGLSLEDLRARRDDCLAEREYLQHQIGPTGLLALRPLQMTSERDDWHQYLLKHAGK
jgi:hypothetical protein